MLDKIVLNRDRTEATIHYDTHSISFYHSEGLVVDLLADVLFEPSARIERSYEETMEIDIQLHLFKDVA
jgi:hypothetical protein